MSTDPYSRSYWRFADEYPDIWADDSCYALWSRLRDLGDMAWPSAGTLPLGTKRAILQRLIEAELVTMTDAMHYRIRGMDKQRAERQESARAGADARWRKSKGNATAMQPHSERNAIAMHIPSLAKPSLAEPSKGDASDGIFDAYYQLTAKTPSSGATSWLNRLADEYDERPLLSALVEEHKADPDTSTLLGRVQTRLADEARRRAKAAEERRKRGAIEEARDLEAKLAQASPEEQARAATVRDSIAALVKGLPA